MVSAQAQAQAPGQPAPVRAPRRRRPLLVIAALAVILPIQLASTAFFISKLLSDVFLWRVPIIPWQLEEWIEVLSSVGMIAGCLASFYLLLSAGRRIRRIETQLKATSGKFQEVIERQFDLWHLTPTERTVSVLVIKGFSNGEIAGLRGTTESTVKSQLTSIFRKAGLGSRQQLVTSIIEDLVTSLPVDELGGRDDPA